MAPFFRRLERYLFVFGIILGLPLLFSTRTMDPGLMPRFTAEAVILIGLLLCHVFNGTRRLKSNDVSILVRPIYPLFAVYLIWTALTIPGVFDVAEALRRWLHLCMSCVFMYLACSILLRKNVGVKEISRAIVILGGLLATIGILQYHRIGFEWLPGSHRIYATLINKNLFASALFLTLPFIVIGLPLFNRYWRWLASFSLTIILFAVYLCRARTVWIAILVALLVVTLIRIIYQKHSQFSQNAFSNSVIRRATPELSLGLTICFGLLLLIASHGIFKSHYQYAHLSLFADSDAQSIFSLKSLKQRRLLWENTIPLIRAAPWTGAGLAQWPIVLPGHGIYRKIGDPSDSRNTVFRRPHNDHLLVFAETGAVGLLIHLSIYGLAIYYIIRIIFRCKNDETRKTGLGLLFGAVGYFVIAALSFPSERIVHSNFWMLICAIAVGLYHNEFPIQRRVGPKAHILVNMVSILILSFCFYVGQQRTSGEIHLKKAEAARMRQDWQKVIEETSTINQRFFSSGPNNLPVSWYRGVARFYLNNTEAALFEFSQAYRTNPYHIHVLNNLGVAFHNSGDYLQAFQCYRKALQLYPTFHAARENLRMIIDHVGPAALNEGRFVFIPNSGEKDAVELEAEKGVM